MKFLMLLLSFGVCYVSLPVTSRVVPEDAAEAGIAAVATTDDAAIGPELTAAAEAVKEKAPEVSEQLGEAARRAGTVITSAVHRDTTPKGTTSERTTSERAAAEGTSTGGTSTEGSAAAAGGGIPAHSTHPETVNLGTSTASAPSPASAPSDVETDPALNDKHGQDWSDEGGATPAGAATNVDPDKVS